MRPLIRIGIRMEGFALAATALFCCLSGGGMSALAQQPVAVPVPAVMPLAKMPYSPSLDVTSLDRSVNPCTDFYKFSCGGWMAKNPIPADQAGWSVYAKLGNDNEQFLWGILADDAKAANRTAVQQKVGDYFESCMNTAAIDGVGLGTLQPVLQATNDLQTRAEVFQSIPYLTRKYPGSFFFNSGTEQDAADASKIIAGVNAGGLGLPDRDYYLKSDPASVKLLGQYSAYIQHVFALAGESPEAAKTDAESILHIETTLAGAQLTRVEMRDPHKIYHPMKVSGLAQLTPAIEWVKFFDKEGAPHSGTLNVSQPAYMKLVQAELATEPLPALKAYLRFHLLNGSANYLATPFREASFDFYGKTLRGIDQKSPRWKTCVRAVDTNLGEALGQEFVARTFTADMKARTELMTGQIEQEMGREIEGLDWMSPATKAEALRKLHAIRNKVGYPAHWRDYKALTVKRDDYFGDAMRAFAFERARQWAKLGKPVDLNEWGMTPPTVNAYFNPQMNDINFPAGVLQPPLYDPSLDDAPNYGNTGATIGHELTHAFDDEGRQFDAKGNLRDWWTPADAKGFEDRINCVRQQYAGYVVVDDIHINSKLTSGEDVADLGGTLLAYLASGMQENGKTPESKDGFTPDQRFFVGMAQWACENNRPEAQRVQAITDPHSPGFARINGVVSNLPQFAKAFGCKAGQPMVHAPTCRVW